MKLGLVFAVVLMGQDSPEAHLGKGYEALRQDRYDEAAAEFRAALKLDPKLVMRARFPLAVALFEMKEADAARREFDAVRAEAGDQPNVAYYLGRLDLQEQKYPSAIHNFTKAMEKPPFPDTAYQLGFAYFKQGDLAAAEKWLKTTKDSVGVYQLGMVYRKLGREEEAAKAFALSGQLRQRDAAESELRLECAKTLDRAVCGKLYDPNNAEKLTALGTIYGQHGDLEAALEPLRRAAELSPQSPQMQYNLAFTFYRLNRLAEAREPLEKAIARWPDLFPLKALYGAVLLKMGEERAAYEALRGAHDLNPQDSRTVELLYGVTLSLARKAEGLESKRYFDEAAKLKP